MKIEKGVMHTQTKGCKFCLHIGTIAIYMGYRRKDGKQGVYLGLFTPFHIFKFSTPQ
jgi:hypothetical protein